MPPERAPAAGSPEQWLRHAHSDLRAGIVLRADERVLSEKACFHFQQAADYPDISDEELDEAQAAAEASVAWAETVVVPKPADEPEDPPQQ